MERFRFIEMFFLTIIFASALTAFAILLSWFETGSLQESFEIIYKDFFPFLRIWIVCAFLFLVIISFIFHPMIEQAKKDSLNLDNDD